MEGECAGGLPRDIAQLFRAQGIALAGVAPAISDPDRQAEYDEWIAAGYHGSMGYLERHAPLKYQPDRVLPGCRSILVAALGYYREAPRETPRAHGRISRYAMGRDYHKVLGVRLRGIARALSRRHPRDTFRSFVDTGPLAERFYAHEAGLGFVGRNTLLITPSHGSWVVIGEILSTREFTGTLPRADRARAGTAGEPTCPPNCRRCVRACPTRALYAPHRIDASRCISYLTIEHRGLIPTELRPLMGDRLFGCDTCQEVCPLNANVTTTEVADFRADRAGATQELGRILQIRDDEELVRLFAGSPLVRAKRASLVRNACVVAANNTASELLPLLRALAEADTDPLVAEHARWAIQQLAP